MNDQKTIFAIAYLSYASVHAARKSFSNAKAQLHDFYGFSASEAGNVDALFMLIYAAGLILGGRIADKSRTSRVFGVGLLGTSIFQALLGYLCIQGPSLAVYAAVVLSAAFQSLTWPAAIKLVSEAYEASHRSLAFGLWVTNTAIGNILGSLLASYSLHTEGEREGVLGVFLIPAALCLIAALLVLGILKDRRSYEHLAPLNGVSDSNDQSASMTPAVVGAIPYSECFMLPGVAAFSISYGLLKGVAYAMFFWLPFYFVQVRNFDPAASDAFSGLFDVGQVLGAPVCGFIAHKSGGKLFLVCALSGLLAAAPLLTIAFTDAIPAVGAALVLAGVFLGGAVGLIGSEVCVVLCPSATSTVVGIIDGFGSLGASLTQALIPMLAGQLGWAALFPECAAMASLGAAVLWRPVLREQAERAVPVMETEGM